MTAQAELSRKGRVEAGTEVADGPGHSHLPRQSAARPDWSTWVVKSRPTRKGREPSRGAGRDWNCRLELPSDDEAVRLGRLVQWLWPRRSHYRAAVVSTWRQLRVIERRMTRRTGTRGVLEGA